MQPLKPQNQKQNQRIPWNIRIQAKAKHFHLNFNFKSSTSFSFFKFHSNQRPFSLNLNAKFLKCRLLLSSDYGSSSSSTKSAIKSKFINFFRKLMPKKSKGSTFFPKKRALKLQPNKGVWLVVLAATLALLASHAAYSLSQSPRNTPYSCVSSSVWTNNLHSHRSSSVILLAWGKYKSFCSELPKSTNCHRNSVQIVLLNAVAVVPSYQQKGLLNEVHSLSNLRPFWFKGLQAPT